MISKQTSDSQRKNVFRRNLEAEKENLSARDNHIF